MISITLGLVLWTDYDWLFQVNKRKKKWKWYDNVNAFNSNSILRRLRKMRKWLPTSKHMLREIHLGRGASRKCASWWWWSDWTLCRYTYIICTYITFVQDALQKTQQQPKSKAKIWAMCYYCVCISSRASRSSSKKDACICNIDVWSSSWLSPPCLLLCMHFLAWIFFLC